MNNLLKNKVFKKIWGYIEITFGVLFLDLAFYFFFTPTDLVTGGAMGLSIILSPILPFSSSIFLYIFNGITLVLGLVALGKEFFLKTVYASVLSPTIVLVLELTCDPNFFMNSVVEGRLIIACIVGSVLVAAGLGLCFRNNGCTGGMDVIQKVLVKYLHMPYSKTMYVTDWVVVILGGFSITGGFNYNIEMVTYGVIAVLLIGFLVDSIAMRGRTRRTAYIITTKPDEVKEMIFNKISRGLTIVDCKGGYTGEDKTLIICTLDKSESYLLAAMIEKIDNKAFTFMSATREVVGDFAPSPNRR